MPAHSSAAPNSICVVVNLRKKLDQDVRESRPRCRRRKKPKIPGQQAGDAVDGDAAGEFAGFSPPRRCRRSRRKQNLRRPARGLAGLAEVVYFVAVEGEGEKARSVVAAHAADVGEAGPAEVGWRRGGALAGGVDGVGSIFSGFQRDTIRALPSSRVANSKSMMQKRPSVAR